MKSTFCHPRSDSCLQSSDLQTEQRVLGAAPQRVAWQRVQALHTEPACAPREAGLCGSTDKLDTAYLTLLLPCQDVPSGRNIYNKDSFPQAAV